MRNPIYFLLICFTGILFSCSEDETIHTHEKVHEHPIKEYKRSIVKFKDMLTRLSSVDKQVFALFYNLDNKGGGDYIQAIDSTYIIQYDNNSLTTYTLRVSTMDDGNYSYSNLIIRLIDGEVEEFVAHYTPTEEWQVAHNNGEYLVYEGVFELTDINGVKVESEIVAKVTNCTFSIVPNWVNCHGSSCPCEDGNGYQNGYNVIVVCNSAPGIGGGGDPGGSGTNPDLPTDPTGGNGGGQGTVTPLAQELNSIFGEGNWIEVQNPPSNLPSFDDLLDAWDYVYGESSTGNNGTQVDIQDGDQRVTHYKVKFWSTIWGERGVRMYVGQTRDDGQALPNITSITSQWYGGSFYNSWSQHQNYDIETLPGHSDSKRITIYGTLTQGFEYKGYGYFVDTEYKIQFIINKLGQISFPFWWNID